MKILLIALNAKYIHSSLALQSIKVYCNGYKDCVDIVEFTINNDENFIISEVYKKNPSIVCFSCYIWNIEQILNITKTLKKLMPSITIVLGGPEVSYDIEDIMKENSEIDIIIYGEGEATFLDLIKHSQPSLATIDGLAYREDNKIIVNKQRNGLDLNKIPFVYNENNIDYFKNKIIYYETSRGCPYQCQYCLSSIEKGVRFLSLERVYNDLDFFLKHRVKQVKLVDRTFNCNKAHAMSIWKYLKDNDNKITNFHFEITADLIDDEVLELLKDVRVGLFQFEIGVQSTNDKTIKDIKRNVDFNTLAKVVKKIKSFKNIHQHLDLIAGLPEEDYTSFGKSFDDVYALEPEQFQLGFLKLLKGSALRKDATKYGLVYKDKAPYEILFTDCLNYDDVIKLKMIEEMVELYYNSSKCIYTLKYIIPFFDSPFKFYESLSQYWIHNNHHLVQHNKIELYTILFSFCKTYFNDELEAIKDLLKFDMFLNDNIKSLPVWLSYNKTQEQINKIKSFYNDKSNIEKYLPELIDYEARQISRMTHIEPFNYDIVTWLDNGTLNMAQNMILFNYYRKAYINGHAYYNKIQ